MVDVTRVPDNAFGYVPTPALVAPIEFTLRRDDYVRLGGHAAEIRTRRRRAGAAAANISTTAARHRAPASNPWPPLQQLRRSVEGAVMSGPQAHWLPDGRRLHLNHGPIDLIIEAFGEQAEVPRRLRPGGGAVRDDPRRTRRRNCPSCAGPPAPAPRAFAGPTARRMEAAVRSLAENSSRRWRRSPARSPTKSGGACLPAGRLESAYVNNGGDIAIHLGGRPAIDRWRSPAPAMAWPTASSIRAEDPVRGIATSGWRGRSFSLGIADAVTVLARTRRCADAAATMIANAVDLPGHPAIVRMPAAAIWRPTATSAIAWSRDKRRRRACRAGRDRRARWTAAALPSPRDLSADMA